MDKPDKEFYIRGLWFLAAFAVLVSTICNTVFPIVNGEPAYAVFNLVACGIAGAEVYRNLKDKGGA